MHDIARSLHRRVAFNVTVGNCDDHLRNHGFILTPDDWWLAPAFDWNSSIDRAEHILNIDESDNRPSVETVIATAEWYGLSKARGAALADEILQLTRTGRAAATKVGIAKADIEITSSAFAATDASG